MQIRAGTDGVGRTFEVIRAPNETDEDEARILATLITFLMQQLQKKL